MSDNDDLIFAPETDEKAANGPAWKLLIVDDEDEVHRVTRLALDGLRFDGRPLEFLNAYSGEEAIALMRREKDVAIILMDVVMESDTAGLDAVRVIREEIGNAFVRIVLRTGQPGQAPERDVVTRYDINDYREKTELTAKKLFTLVYTSLTLYRDLHRRAQHERGLSAIIEIHQTILRRRSPDRLAHGVLMRLGGMVGLDAYLEDPGYGGIAVMQDAKHEPTVLAATGRFKPLANQPLAAVPDAALRAQLLAAPPRGFTATDTTLTTAVATTDGAHAIFHVCGPHVRVADDQILDLFIENIAVALQNARTQAETDRSQRELTLMLAEAIEARSEETGNHVRRVAAYSRLLAELSGLDRAEALLLETASPLHDAGKIAIPDAILNKPGRLDSAERERMNTHAELGRRMFASQDLPVLKAAAIIAGEHHERWDGLGYPGGLKGEEIHIYGRITALADVFDALRSRRCYKEPWTLDDVVSAIRAERGRHFDPRLVDLLIDNLEAFVQIGEQLQDHHAD